VVLQVGTIRCYTYISHYPILSLPIIIDVQSIQGVVLGVDAVHLLLWYSPTARLGFSLVSNSTRGKGYIDCYVFYSKQARSVLRRSGTFCNREQFSPIENSSWFLPHQRSDPRVPPVYLPSRKVYICEPMLIVNKL
jgi:hypothetical protein